jgi:myosin heavy subunit
MEPGTKVWAYQSSGDDPWILSEVTSRTPTALSLKYLSGDHAGQCTTRPLVTSSSLNEDGTKMEVVAGTKKYEGVELANPPLSEREIKEGQDADMISLPHLHEPAILHAVSERYFRGEIYTWTGPVLIAVNPFQRLPLYTRVS